MFDALTATRRAYLTALSQSLSDAAATLRDLADLEASSPIGKRGAWNYPIFLLSTAVEAVTAVAATLAPGAPTPPHED